METFIRTVGLDPDIQKEALRYCVERIRLAWPDCIVEDHEGEAYGRLSTHFPDQIRIKTSPKAGRFTTLELSVQQDGIKVVFFKPVAEMAQHIQQDPIWHPDWESIRG